MYEFTNRETGEKLRCRFLTVEPDNKELLEGMALCVRDEYGDSYPRKSVYDAAALSDEIRSGNVICILAVSEEGDPVSSLALTPCGGLEGVPELTVHVVRHAYRGFGIGTVLTKALLEHPKVKSYCAVTAHSVTFHPKAQHQTLRCGLIPTGFLFSIHSNKILKHSFSVEGVLKQSFAVSVFPEDKKDAGVIYAPAEHKDFISGIYEKLGAAFSLGEGEKLEGATRMHINQDETHHTMTAELFSCGDEVDRWAASVLAGQHFPDQTLNLLININDPSAPAAYEKLKALGFIFTGLHPLCKNGEFMILHHPMGVPVIFDKLCIDEGYREVFDYIRDKA